MNWLDIAKDFVLVAFSSFSGAGIAFFFAIKHEKRKQEDNQYIALRLAHFPVMSQLQELILVRDSYLSDFDGQPDAWLRLRQVILGFAAKTLNVSELGFAFESSDPDLLNRLVVGEARYLMIRNIIAIRNDAHHECQRRAAALQAKGIDSVDDEETLNRMLGKDLVAQLKDLTAELVDGNRAAILLLEANLKAITALSTERFPKRRAPKIEILPKSKAAQGAQKPTP